MFWEALLFQIKILCSCFRISPRTGMLYYITTHNLGHAVGENIDYYEYFFYSLKMFYMFVEVISDTAVVVIEEC